MAALTRHPRPKTSSRDARITREAADRLQTTAYAPLRRLEVRCRDGVLSVRGIVHCYYLKQLAQSALDGIADAVAIENRIVVLAGAAELPTVVEPDKESKVGSLAPGGRKDARLDP